MADYISLEECVELKQHLKSCDDDGYCNSCGEQDTVEIDNEGNCIYCGQKCWIGQMCDEQQAGGFKNNKAIAG